MNDLISRAAAIEAVTIADRNCLGAHGAREAIRALPAAAQPEAEPVADDWLDMPAVGREFAATPAPVVPAEGLAAAMDRLQTEICCADGDRADAAQDHSDGSERVDLWPHTAEFDVDDVRMVLTALRSAPPVGARVKPLAAIFDAAQAEAEKAMRKFPQPNYVISKVAEEAGEVVKAAIHCAENRETKEAVLGEVVQCMAMLIRLCLEGDQVHGLAALLPAGEGE